MPEAVVDVHFNRLFLVYVAILGLSFYALVGSVIHLHLDRLRASFSANTTARAVSVFLLVLGIVFYLLSCYEQQGDADERCRRGVYCDHNRGEPCPERALFTRSQIKEEKMSSQTGGGNKNDGTRRLRKQARIDPGNRRPYCRMEQLEQLMEQAQLEQAVRVGMD